MVAAWLVAFETAVIVDWTAVGAETFGWSVVIVVAELEWFSVTYFAPAVVEKAVAVAFDVDH